MRFTVACVQIAPEKAHYIANIQRIGESIARCVSEGADVIVFPETATTGYFLEGGVFERAVTSERLALDIQKESGTLDKEVDVVVGFYELDNGTVYNSAAHLQMSRTQCEVKHVHRKFFLPTYGVFDEERFVARGRNLDTYESRFGHLGLLICEDVWHSVSSTILALKGAAAIFVLAASPARGFSGEKIGNWDRYRQLISSPAAEHGIWMINSMLVGFEGGKGFVGGSIIADPMGRIVAEGPIGEEHILIAEIDLDAVSIARQRAPLLADLMSSLEDVTREFEQVNETTCGPR